LPRWVTAVPLAPVPAIAARIDAGVEQLAHELQQLVLRRAAAPQPVPEPAIAAALAPIPA